MILSLPFGPISFTGNHLQEYNIKYGKKAGLEEETLS
jgi:hypothetical protein